MTADLFDDRLKFYACLAGRDQAHEAVEPPVQIGLVDLERAAGKSVASTPDGAGALEQALQTGREHRVARVDRVLDVATFGGLRRDARGRPDARALPNPSGRHGGPKSSNPGANRPGTHARPPWSGVGRR